VYDRHIPPADFFPSYLSTYVERDVRALRQIGDLGTFSRFLRLCANRVGQVLNLTSLGNEAGIDAKTAKAWISILEASFVLFLLRPFHRNFNKRIVKTPKLYFYDTGLACSLIGLTNPDQVTASYLRGALFENLVLAELHKAASHAGIPVHFSFWRDNTGNEVDLIIERGPDFSAVEVKSGETLTTDAFHSLVRFQRFSGLPADRTFLVYGGDKAMERKAATVLPWLQTDLLLG
jgi:uncharacterized protein